MNITVLKRGDAVSAAKLWNRCVEAGDVPYAPLTPESFESIFFDNPHYTEEYTLAARDEDGTLLGFASALVKRHYLQGEDFDNTPAYLTMLMTDPAHRGKGVASAILDALEKRFAAVGKHRMAVTYRNPVILTWQVPGCPGVFHNNAPGVAVDSDAFRFLSKRGYRQLRVEDGMYLPLAEFVMSADCRRRLENLEAQGIEIGFYDAARHTGFEELFDALHGEVWRETMRVNAALENPLPVLIAADGGRIVGFAGPIDKEPNGRGWFNGIATHPGYQGRGIAKVLFQRLMEEFRKIGAGYSTLFTDEENPALNLYRSVGFEVAKRFAVMEKEL